MGTGAAFVKGFVGMTLVLFLLGAVAATWYASRVEMGGSTIAWSSFTPSSSDELATKLYVDDNIIRTNCSFVSAGSSSCGSGYCYANPATASQYCRDQGYNFSTSYQYYKIYQSSAYLWTGSSYTSTSSEDISAPPPIGGGQLQATGSSSVSVLTYAYCCKV